MMGKKRCLMGDAKWDYLLIVPAIIGLIVLNIYPFLQILVLSFSTTRPFGYYEVNGAENYVQMFGSRELWKATWNSIYFCILTVPLGIFLSLLVAVLLDTKIRTKAAFRTIYFLPMVVAPAAIAMTWKWIFNVEYGIISQVIGSRVNWLTSPKLMFPAYTVMAVWSAMGYDAVLLLSGIQSISKSYYEAASLGWASRVEQFFKITLPVVSPTLSVVLIMRFTASPKTCDLIYVMVDQTNPALMNAQLLIYFFYRESFMTGNRGYTSAIAVRTVLLIGAVIVLQFWGQERWVNHEVQDGGKL